MESGIRSCLRQQRWTCRRYWVEERYTLVLDVEVWVLGVGLKTHILGGESRPICEERRHKNLT
jgi:hypothetical protein